MRLSVVISLCTVVGSFTQTGTYDSSWLHIRQVRLVGAGPSATLAAHKIVSIPPTRKGPTCATGLSGDRVARAVPGWIEVLKWKECGLNKLTVTSVRTQEGAQLVRRSHLPTQCRNLSLTNSVREALLHWRGSDPLRCSKCLHLQITPLFSPCCELAPWNWVSKQRRHNTPSVDLF